jgi:hypothetical protein
LAFHLGSIETSDLSVTFRAPHGATRILTVSEAGLEQKDAGRTPIHRPSRLERNSLLNLHWIKDKQFLAEIYK